ncbi:putative bifunctional diguanylate cyclase/phosphodiesterase [Candidatus Reidiella endopervernicosa]|uniref:putative bifunctional diguanylate cyclase/phosphodiesterase n=1 Tax=Candidatus Reidiella endopervernicosa TaxID=2738883 RepID=UPI001F3DA4A7|nr:bifunctional diguanylate cyclase/phosphodiesterase [Candidatus Reidiella endopervernicosa]
MLDQHIAYAERYAHSGGLLFIDLDQFKYINDTYGHHSGDEYLTQVAKRLQRTLRNTDVLGRLGGDEFGVILPRVEEGEAEQVATNLLEALTGEELIHGEHASRVSASIGIALFPEQGTLPSELLARADTAMYAAKELGRNRYHIYCEQDVRLARMHDKVRWEDRIHQALENDRFVLHYQPIVNLKSGAISHYEALLRMLDDDDTLIPPGAFLDTAERFGLIRDIDRWVVEQTIRTQGVSEKRGEPVKLAINLSGRNFGDNDFLELVRNTITISNADPHAIIFEVTETVAVENLDKARSFINDLRELGCSFALDDFGVGFASFHYLKNLNVDYIKIDGSFVRNLHQDSTDQVFIRAIHDVARSLNMTAIAEFIENDEILAILQEIGIDMGQGYYLSRPQADFLPVQTIKGISGKATLSQEVAG